ncbi:MAG: carboxypeptidase-like regulatory domain-containing protein [Ginsengibacter sp.]
MFLVASKPNYGSFEPFAAEVNDFNANFQNLERIVPGKTANATGVTTDKTALKHELAKDIALVCRKTRAYALRFGQPELAAQTNTWEGKIFHMKDTDMMSYSTSVVNLLTPLMANTDYIPYGITAASLDAITTRSTNFNHLIGKAQQSESVNATTNTAINKAINLLHGNISHMDLLVDEFENSDPGFVQGYHINSSVDNVGVHHSGIRGTVRNTGGEPMAHVTIALEGTAKEAVTDLMGVYRLDRVSPGDYRVEVSAAGYASTSVVHHISSGRIDELDFQLAS